MGRKCTCADYEPNVEKINAPMALQHARNPLTYKGYDGKIWQFCPWCGSKLIETEGYAAVSLEE